MPTSRYFRAAFVLAWFWLWAFHVSTGFLDNLIASESGMNAGIVKLLDNITNALLIAPFGRTVSVMLLFAAGILFSALAYRWGTDRRPAEVKPSLDKDDRFASERPVESATQDSANRMGRIRTRLAGGPASVEKTPESSSTAKPKGSLSERSYVEFLAATTSDGIISREIMEEHWRMLRGDDAELDDDLYEKAVARAKELLHRQTPHGEKVDPVAIVRKPREKHRDWSHDRSWLGGLPKLGDIPWPRDKDGMPLPFVAQIDLAEVAAVNPNTSLPADGSLAFFIGSGAVVHIPAGEREDTPAPPDLPPAYDEGAHPLPERSSHVTHRTFPFWPVEPIRLRLPSGLPNSLEDDEAHDAIYEAQYKALHAQVAPRQSRYSAYSAEKAGIAGADKLWWYGAQHILRQLRNALDYVDQAITLRHDWIAQAQAYQARLAAEDSPDQTKIAGSQAGEARHRAQIPLIREQAEGLKEFIGHFEQFVAGRAPWGEMTSVEIDTLQEVLREARKSFPDLCGYHVSIKIDDIHSLCVRRMITGDAEAVEALPDSLLNFINQHHRLATQNPHQMFGLGGCKQTALYDHLCDHLLLQLGPDEMAEMSFGDMGIWQFWISPEDLAASRFDRAQLTFECS